MIVDGADKAAVVLHGLEGNSRRPYIVCMAAVFLKAGWDVFALNCRGCGGEPNRLPVFYHQGSTGDLHTILEFIQAEYPHEELALVGFSLGGNLLLKYLGDGVFPVSERIVKAAAISVPCDLLSCSEKLAAPSNMLYMRYFLRSLEKKVKEKKRMYPDLIDDNGFDGIRTFMEFDDRYTAPLHGFHDALDYYRQCGCGRFLEGIEKPVLLINALDDPFLSEKCYPFEIADKSESLHLETPRWGGHSGFVSFDNEGLYWHERRVIEFVRGKHGIRE
jgi:predicted alpha/beta-fold hydrolase